MKPWEETWEVRENAFGSGPAMVMRPHEHGLTLSVANSAGEFEDGREDLVAAAPELYRLLLELQLAMENPVQDMDRDDQRFWANERIAPLLKKARGE